ncbi:unnamed protein product [Cuscuta europaea]|uniref:Uncharacterized protein n=1 Tax=Cuscuta europaea TaxID=41803 RepID=A0A9P1EBX8_CUSEU|nr:unnamed protein product [Cuscuta europaea]
MQWLVTKFLTLKKMQSSPLGTPFTSATTLTQSGLNHLPQSYVVPPSQRPDCTLSTTHPSNHNLPLIDLSSLKHPLLRSQVVEKVGIACKDFGFFQGENMSKQRRSKRDPTRVPSAVIFYMQIIISTRLMQVLISVSPASIPRSLTTTSHLQ